MNETATPIDAVASAITSPAVPDVESPGDGAHEALAEQPLSPTARSTVRRMRERARVDRADLYAVLDAASVCHLGVVADGAPVVLPTCYGRDGNTLYLHGSTGARSLWGDGEVCVTVTLLDGIVYGRSVMHCSANYRSAVVHGRLRALDGADKLHGLRVIVDHMTPGWWDHARSPSRKELAATAVLALDLSEAAVKVRTGDPGDDPADIARGGVWAGVLPLRQVWDPPIPSTDLESALDVPDVVTARVG